MNNEINYELITSTNRDVNFGVLHLASTRSKKILFEFLKYPENDYHYLKVREELRMPVTYKIEAILDKFL